ncbi:ligand-binding SRPBCC domain-containing protein [Algoriphagus sp. 4150]|uniref:SRPBCC family protein n=1 Tax=Algoriphagus sp. 4150 TaxID=2817756 RepID=UPI00285570FF|nr:SRPBCC family protein [Algoriphagus sp. 4150]MDR7129791.1 ligand-binding SRPBCC domain-containing protein [Algoriphagus sp. 4150]
MPRIEIRTEIKADIQLVFDLSRSIDLHKISTEHTNETAVAGITSGLIGMNESVTWRARHFGVYQTLTSRISDFNHPIFFADEMVSGAFRSFRHEHHFIDSSGVTIMTDIFDYRSPMGILGVLADNLFLKKYMTKLLVERNRIVKEFAESDRGRELLTGKTPNFSNYKRY